MKLFLGIFLITVLSLIWACDEIKEVAPPIKPVDSTVTLIQDKDFYSQPNNFIAIDTKSLLKSSGYASIKMENTPVYGKMTFSKTGYLVYKADSTKSEVTEVLIYKMMNGNPAKDKRDTLRIHIAANISQVPCNAGAIPDVFTVKVNTSTLLDVLANDRYCNAIVDSSSFKIIEQPLFGTAVIQNNKVLYTPNNNLEQNDIFFYQICTKGTNPVCKVVGVKINIEGATCRNILVPDILVIDKNDTTAKVIKVLENDKICDNYDRKSLKISIPPQFGKAIVNANADIEYTQTANKEGNDLFEYMIYDKNGANPQKMVVQVIIRNTPECKPDVKNGQMEISASQVKDTEIEIPYFLYVSNCTVIKEISIESKPTFGMIRIQDKKIYYKLKQQDGKEYNDQFKYVITTTNNDILKANFTVRIKK